MKVWHNIKYEYLTAKGDLITDAQVLTVSSKGQIVLPVGMRRSLSIETGDKLVAYTSGEVIMLKVLKLPTAEECKEAMDEARQWAASVGYEEDDVADIIKEGRKKKRGCK